MDMKQITDLVIAAQGGDKEALNKLFEQCYNELYYCAYIAIKNEDVAGDVLQDALVEIMESIKSLQNPETYLVWAKQIVRRFAHKYMKAQSEYISIDEEESVQQIVDDDISANPSEHLDNAEFSDTLFSFLSKLPSEQRSVVMQYYFDEMSIAQIAQAEGVPEMTVRSLLNKARKALQYSVREYENKYAVDLYGNSCEKLYDIHISYSRQDLELANQLAEELRKDNMSVSMNVSDSAANDFLNAADESISRSRVILPIITQNSLKSAYCFRELQNAIEHAKERAKALITVCYVPDALAQIPELSVTNGYSLLTPTGTDPASIAALGRQISGIIRGKKLETVLFETLSEYINAGLNDRATDVLCQLIRQLCEQILVQKSKSYLTLISYLEKMSELYTCDYGKDARELAHKKLDALKSVGSLLQTERLQSDDLYYISIAIRLIYLDREIRLDCADAITGGDVMLGIVKTLPEQEYAERQKTYVEKYQRLLEMIDSYPEAQRQFICDTEKYIYNQPERITVSRPVVTPSTPEDELLQAIASFTREGNKLFDLIGEKQPAKEFLQCLITSYERLKSYSELVGAKQICAECIDRIAELKNKLIHAGEPTAAMEKSETGIKTLLGLTIPQSGKYDVFLSHKNADLDITRDVYDFLRRNLIEPFLDSVSLPQMSKSEYSKAIDLALEGSRHFIVVLSDLAYMESHWVEYEMDCFHTEIKEGRKEGGNFLFIVTDEVYDQIISNNKRDLPLPYRRYQIFRLSEYQESLLGFLPT